MFRGFYKFQRVVPACNGDFFQYNAGSVALVSICPRRIGLVTIFLVEVGERLAFSDGSSANCSGTPPRPILEPM